jgi:hypothetical protein
MQIMHPPPCLVDETRQNDACFSFTVQSCWRANHAPPPFSGRN